MFKFLNFNKKIFTRKDYIINALTIYFIILLYSLIVSLILAPIFYTKLKNYFNIIVFITTISSIFIVCFGIYFKFKIIEKRLNDILVKNNFAKTFLVFLCFFIPYIGILVDLLLMFLPGNKNKILENELNTI